MHNGLVQNRVNKYLGPLQRFRCCTEFDLGSRFECCSEWDPAGLLGIYDNDIANGDCLVVTEAGFVVCRGWKCDVFVAYASIVEVSSPTSKERANGVVCGVSSGAQVFIPVSGSRGPFIDSFSFATFLKGMVMASAARRAEQTIE